jgi:hypothetical protein
VCFKEAAYTLLHCRVVSVYVGKGPGRANHGASCRRLTRGGNISSQSPTSFLMRPDMLAIFSMVG